jgi:L-alanine-DL-glutamate epimerase-like enolase superfamily enzyme
MLSRRNLLAGAGGLAGIAALPGIAAGRKERLTITKVELFRVCPPLQDGVLAKSAGPDFDKVPKFVLKVHTDSGIVGLGETHRMGGGENSEGVVRLRRAAEALRGTNVLDLNLSRLELPWAKQWVGLFTVYWVGWGNVRCW